MKNLGKTTNNLRKHKKATKNYKKHKKNLGKTKETIKKQL